MSEYRKIPLGSDVQSMDVTPKFGAYTGVEIIRDENHSNFSGNRSGRVLTIENQWGDIYQARNILSSLKAAGFQYQPFTAAGAILDPAAELGDGVSAAGVYSGIYLLEKRFGPLMAADISAPQDEEVDHEYPFEPKQDRIYKREIADTRAQISIQADRITSEVSRLDAADSALSSRITQTASDITAEVSGKLSANGGKTSTFGWKLTGDAWEIYANKKTVLKATAAGLAVTGEITATSGKIGGFTIGKNAITYGDLTYGDATEGKNGIYIGTSGIQLGSKSGSYLQASRTGNVVANNLTLTGTLTIGGERITANDLRQGANRANAGYSSWNSTTSHVNNRSGVWNAGGVAGEKFDNMASNSGAYPINATTLIVDRKQFVPTVITFVDGNGITRRWEVLSSTF